MLQFTLMCFPICLFKLMFEIIIWISYFFKNIFKELNVTINMVTNGTPGVNITRFNNETAIIHNIDNTE